MPSDPYRKTTFLLSAMKLDQLPEDEGLEVAFVGRSNVGKSSIINAITGRKALARTSKFPGRTQQLNYFSISENTRLVDLPGYGYAKVPRQLKAQWSDLVNGYFNSRQSLVGLILIMDIRRDITEQELTLMKWCETVEIPVHLLLNKADKLATGARNRVLNWLRKRLAAKCGSVQLFSATHNTGMNELRAILDKWLFV